MRGRYANQVQGHAPPIALRHSVGMTDANATFPMDYFRLADHTALTCRI